MKRKALENRLKKMDWMMVRHGRRHDIWTNDDFEIAVPRHSEINEYTAESILREAGEKN